MSFDGDKLSLGYFLGTTDSFFLSLSLFLHLWILIFFSDFGFLGIFIFWILGYFFLPSFVYISNRNFRNFLSSDFGYAISHLRILGYIFSHLRIRDSHFSEMNKQIYIYTYMFFFFFLPSSA